MSQFSPVTYNCSLRSALQLRPRLLATAITNPNSAGNLHNVNMNMHNMGMGMNMMPMVFFFNFICLFIDFFIY